MHKWTQSVVFLAITLAGMAAVQLGWLDVIADKNVFRHRLLDGNVVDILLITGIGIIYTGVGAPRQLLAFASGFALGPLWGTIYATVLTVAGAAGCFYTARWFLRPVLQYRAGDQLRSFDRLTRDNPFLKVLMIRLLPVGSNLLTNLFAGSSRIGVVAFMTGSATGYLPQTVVFTLVGAGFGQASELQLLAGILMFGLAAVLGMRLYRSHQNRQLSSTIIQHQDTV